MSAFKGIRDKIGGGELKTKLERFKQRFPRKPPLAQATFCPNMFSDVFVNDHGEVYTCCHYLPFKVGNLHKNTLEEIWNSKKMKAGRALSLNRSLICFDRCTLLDEGARKQKPSSEEKLQMPYDRLTRIKLLFGKLCNIACIMCDQDHESKIQVSLELVQNQIDWTHITDIEFQGGEPLAMKECKKAYEWLTEEKGKKVNFLTNGTLISEKWAEKLCNGSSWLYFSINGVEPETFERVSRGAKFERVMQGVERMQAARKRLDSPIDLVGHFTMVPENIGQVDQFPEFGAKLGFDRVEFGYDLSSIPRWIKENPDDVQRIRRSFERIIADSPLPVRDHRLRQLGLVV